MRTDESHPLVDGAVQSSVTGTVNASRIEVARLTSTSGAASPA
jgi:hypothetical protein